MEQKEDLSVMYALKRNNILLFGAIDSNMAYTIISELQYLDYEFEKAGTPDDERIITMQIDSPGGSVTDGLAIIDTMKRVKAKVSTIGIGMVASMGAFLLAAGEKGMRYATDNCEVMIHQPMGGASGQASDIVLVANHINKVKDKMNSMMADYTGQPIERILKDTDRDTYMTADEACEYGLIDKVI